MSAPGADAAIARARELSRGMMEVANRGDMQGVLELDALRSRLLHEFLDQARQLADPERAMLNEIMEINKAVIGKLETMRTGTEQKMQTLGRGMRALTAYSDVQRQGP